MKKILFVLAAVLFTLGAQAQGQGQRQRREFNPEEMATRQATQMKENLKVNDEQYKALYDLYLVQANEMKAQRDSMMARRQQGQQGQRPQLDREAYQKRRDEMQAKIKAILTEEQYAAYEKMQSERRQRGFRGGQGGQGGQRPQRPQRTQE